MLYDEYDLVVDDGRLGHEGLGRFRDMWRDNQAALDALLTLRYGSTDICGRPCAVAVQVGAALAARGWDGVLTRCTRCRLRARLVSWGRSAPETGPGFPNRGSGAQGARRVRVQPAPARV